MSKRLTLVGQTFGRITVVAFVGLNRFGQTVWRYKCECGEEGDASGCKVQRKIDCGCSARARLSERFRALRKRHVGTAHPGFKHGLRHSLTYSSWLSMKARCSNESNPSYRDYGGRGIRICQRWLKSFENFLADMGERPKGTSIDRWPNGDGNYEPGNCRWATASQQRLNQRRMSK